MVWWLEQAAAGNDFPVLNSALPVIKKFCMYSERNSGSNWVSSLIEVSSVPNVSICQLSSPDCMLQQVSVLNLFTCAFSSSTSLYHADHAYILFTTGKFPTEV